MEDESRTPLETHRHIVAGEIREDGFQIRAAILAVSDKRSGR
jgi:hypothetical protein